MVFTLREAADWLSLSALTMMQKQAKSDIGDICTPYKGAWSSMSGICGELMDGFPVRLPSTNTTSLESSSAGMLVDPRNLRAVGAACEDGQG
jgi:hypothetical protein